MENYSYNSYPESGNSSPRSREVEFENPPPWEDHQPPPNYKVKFMCSYGGKIHPRPHDNQLSYVGGETKILAVDRNIRFSSLVAKLSAQCEADVCFKYQLPGEDLDALISVSNDDDLEHMMHEYDRLYRASAKPARLRLFLFPVNQSPVASTTQSVGSTEGKLDKVHFLEALNSVPIQPAPHPPTSAAVAPPGKVDFLFGLEREMPAAVAAKVRDADPSIPGSDVPIHRGDDRDPIQKHIQDLQRLHIAEQQAMYQRKNDENLAAAFHGDYYVQKMPEKVTPTSRPGNVPGTMQIPPGYLPEKQLPGGGFPATTFVSDQQVYMVQAPSGMYQAPIGRQMTGAPPGQGYYGMQRMPHEVYRDQQVYNVMPQAAPPQQPPRTAAYSDGFGMVLPPGGMGVADTGYAQMAYDSSTGRQVYYNAKGAQQAPPPQYQAAMGGAAYNADGRAAGGFNQEGGKVVAAKVSQTSM